MKESFYRLVGLKKLPLVWLVFSDYLKMFHSKPPDKRKQKYSYNNARSASEVQNSNAAIAVNALRDQFKADKKSLQTVLRLASLSTKV